MKKHRPASKAYELSLKSLREKGEGFLEERARELSLPFEDGVVLRFFNLPLKVTCEGVFPERATLAAKIIALHYLLSGGKRRSTGEWISFREVPGGMSYYGVYKRRAVMPLLKAFKTAKELMEAGRRLGWREGSVGDASLLVEALPHIPIMVVMWEGNEEFPSEGDVLFDGSAKDYLPSEDFVKLAKIATTRLIASGRMRDVSP